MNQMQPFIWGANGQMVDPRMRSLQQANFSPIADPMQGWAQMGNAFADNMQSRREASGFPSTPQTFGNLFGLGALLTRQGGGLY